MLDTCINADRRVRLIARVRLRREGQLGRACILNREVVARLSHQPLSYTLFPYTTLFRSLRVNSRLAAAEVRARRIERHRSRAGGAETDRAAIQIHLKHRRAARVIGL